MSDNEDTMEQRRAALVEELHAKGIPLSPPLERAFRTVPRHLFVPGVYLDAVYRDQVIVTRRDQDGVAISSSSQPAIMAIMLNALDLHEGQNVLEIGTGTGYNAALIADLVGRDAGRVTSIEIDAEIAASAKAHLAQAGCGHVQVVHGDGAAGYLPNAPYDRVIATASTWDIPTPWVAQLRANGVLVTPLKFEGVQLGAALRKQPDGMLYSTRLFPLGFVPLRGAAAGPERRIRIPGSALHVTLPEGGDGDAAQIHTLLSDDHELAQLPLELDRPGLGLFSYYLLLHQPEDYQFITYHVEDGRLAYGLEGIGWGILSATSACIVPYGDERVVHVFGGGDAYLTLVELSEQWSAAGQPGPEAMHLVVTPAGARPFQPPGKVEGVRIFERPAHTYTLWLPTTR